MKDSVYYEYIKNKRRKRWKMRQRWMQRQTQLKPPKDTNWYLKFNMEHLGWKLFFKQFGLSEEELSGIVNSIMKE